MFKKLLLVGLVSLLLGFLAFVFVGEKPAEAQKEFRPLVEGEYVPNEVLVKFREDADLSSIQGAINLVQGKIINYLGKEVSLSQWDSKDLSLRSFRLDPNLFHLKVPEGIGTERAIRVLNQLPFVEYAEENGLVYACYTEPNDPKFPNQWALKQISVGDDDAPDAWDTFTGSSDIVVAVIDSGMALTHEDLAANLWVNDDDIQGDGVDNDGNGYVDDTYGWDFVSCFPGPCRDNDPSDCSGHGTKVAGIIGGVGNNNKGVAGINWSIKLMAVRVLNCKDKGYTADVVAGIDYAIENGAHILNNSYGGYKYFSSEVDAILRARAAGRLFIASAGNKGLDTDLTENRHYPSCYACENIISVLATDQNDEKPSWSNYGETTVDIGAPGASILTTLMDGGYGYVDGTSAAAPHVSGVAALVWGKPIKVWHWSQVKDTILNMAEPKDSLAGLCVSGARLSAYEPDLPSAPSNLTATPTAWSIVDLGWQDNSTDEFGFEIQRMKEGESDYSYAGVVEDNDVQYTDAQAAAAGNTNYYKVRAYNYGGNSSFTSPVSVVIPRGSPSAPSALDGWFGFECLCVHLSWYDSANNEMSFEIERKSEYLPWWVQIAVVGSNTTFYDDDVSQYPDTLFQYRVRAYNPDGSSSYSNIAYVYVPWF
ncbi:MAG: S8 family serine peptidase [Candidatus Hydrothermarchaeota archaeon]